MVFGMVSASHDEHTSCRLCDEAMWTDTCTGVVLVTTSTAIF